MDVQQAKTKKFDVANEASAVDNIRRSPQFRRSPSLKMPSDRLGGPVRICRDYSYGCTVCLINKGVRATFVVYCHDLEIGSWQPLQGRSQIPRPNAPPGSAFKL